MSDFVFILFLVFLAVAYILFLVLMAWLMSKMSYQHGATRENRPDDDFTVQETPWYSGRRQREDGLHEFPGYRE